MISWILSPFSANRHSFYVDEIWSWSFGSTLRILARVFKVSKGAAPPGSKPQMRGLRPSGELQLTQLWSVTDCGELINTVHSMVVTKEWF